MKFNKIALSLTMLALMVLMAPIVFACEPPPPPPCEPGYSPGYWKHEIRAQLYDKGAKHYSPAEYWIIFGNTGFIDPYLVYDWLWDNDYKYMWLDIANAFNEAAGLGPYS